MRSARTNLWLNVKAGERRNETAKVCVCLDFLKPKMRINKKVGNKMRFGLRQNTRPKRASFMDL